MLPTSWQLALDGDLVLNEYNVTFNKTHTGFRFSDNYFPMIYKYLGFSYIKIKVTSTPSCTVDLN